jgi:hypothetical protein
MLHWVTFMAANALLFFFWIRLFENPLGSWSETFAMFMRQYLPVLIISLALLPVFLRDAIKISNRFAGPILRVRETLAQVSSGKVPSALSFRTGDFWQSLAVDLNQVLGLKPKTETEPPAE